MAIKRFGAYNTPIKKNRSTSWGVDGTYKIASGDSNARVTCDYLLDNSEVFLTVRDTNHGTGICEHKFQDTNIYKKNRVTGSPGSFLVGTIDANAAANDIYFDWQVFNL